jgi:hypothetical protein
MRVVVIQRKLNNYILKQVAKIQKSEIKEKGGKA